MTDTFKDQNGFARSDVTLANWRSFPYSRWAFQNVRDLVPSAEIRAARPERETALGSEAFLSTRIDTGVEGASTVKEFLDYAQTDGFVVMRDGRVVAEHYAPHSDVNAKHIIFSISKSMTAIISGILEHQGVIDPDKLVSHYLPEAGGSAYGTCSYRDVLDMRVSLDFEEAYLDPLGAFARYRRSTLWNPPDPSAATETLASFLLTLPKAARPHGGPFFYASPNSDLLGLVIERVTGRRFADLMSELLWQPMGAKNDAYITVDAIGTPRTAGGISMTARDLARVGELLRTGGAANGRQIVPESWIADMTTAGDHEAWIAGLNTMLSNGRYRSQWYQTGDADGAYCGIGIHGQWLYVDPSTKTVIVKLSSQPNPLDDELKQDNFAFYRTISDMTF